MRGNFNHETHACRAETGGRRKTHEILITDGPACSVPQSGITADGRMDTA
jgi:hypothetical protein